MTSVKTIVFFGDSLTEGYTLPESAAYPALVGAELERSGFSTVVRNAGISGDTTADGLARVSSELHGDIRLFFLALGANDGRKSVPATVTERNLRSIVGAVREYDPTIEIVLSGVEPISEMDTATRADFERAFSNVAEVEHLPLLPNLLEGVHGVPPLNLKDGIHPNETGHEIIAGRVFAFIVPLL